jgi:hypothetical protein
VSGTRDGIGRSVRQGFADVTEVQSDQRRSELGARESVLEAREEPSMVKEVRLDLYLDLIGATRTHHSHSGLSGRFIASLKLLEITKSISDDEAPCEGNVFQVSSGRVVGW